MTSSVDPTGEIAAILARLGGLITVEGGLNSGVTYEGVDQGTELVIDGFGQKLPYRDFQPGNTIPAATQRLLAANEQQQPNIFAFQVAHVAVTRKKAIALSIETDKCLIGWEPTSNASAIRTFYFNVYDETAKNGERVQWIATRFYETTLGQSPDMSLTI